MLKNNYNKNANGISIEIAACYDSNMSQGIFDDTMQILSNKRNKTSLLYFNNYNGESKKSIADFITTTDKSLQYVKKQYDHNDLDELQDCDRLEILRAIINNEIDDFLLNEKFVCMTSRGYSQGDYSQVIYEKQTDAEGDRAIKTLINHICWDAPVYFRIEIDGDDFYPPLSDEYEYNKEEIINAIIENFPLLPELREELATMMPDTIDYE